MTQTKPHTPAKEHWIIRFLKIVLFPILIMVNPKIYFKDVQDLPDQDKAHKNLD